MEYLKDFSYKELSEVLLIFRGMIKEHNMRHEDYERLRKEIMNIDYELKRRDELIGATYRNGAYSGYYNPSKLRVWWWRFKLIFK